MERRRYSDVIVLYSCGRLRHRNGGDGDTGRVSKGPVNGQTMTGSEGAQSGGGSDRKQSMRRIGLDEISMDEYCQ